MYVYVIDLFSYRITSSSLLTRQASSLLRTDRRTFCGLWGQVGVITQFEHDGLQLQTAQGAGRHDLCLRHAYPEARLLVLGERRSVFVVIVPLFEQQQDRRRSTRPLHAKERRAPPRAVRLQRKIQPRRRRRLLLAPSPAPAVVSPADSPPPLSGAPPPTDEDGARPRDGGADGTAAAVAGALELDAELDLGAPRAVTPLAEREQEAREGLRRGCGEERARFEGEGVGEGQGRVTAVAERARPDGGVGPCVGAGAVLCALESVEGERCGLFVLGAGVGRGACG